MALSYINEVMLLGNVVKQPELFRSTNAKGTEFCYLTIAVERPKYNKDVEPKTDFISVKLYSYSAREAVEELQKGDKVLVKGSVEIYQNKEKQNVTQISASKIAILGKKHYAKDLSVEKEEKKYRHPDDSFADEISVDDTSMPFDL
jgi:single stranded DNA-binding protein